MGATLRISIHASICSIVLATSALVVTPAYADEVQSSGDFAVSGYVEGVTDYRWRGVSASAGDFAIQGSINVSHSSGFYVGAWASSIKEDEANVYGNTEVDLNAGWTGKVISGVTADVGLYYYAYPSGHVGNANVLEPYVSLATAIGPVTGKVGVAYAWKQDALGGMDNLYLSSDLSGDIPGVPVTLSAHVGYSDGAWSPNYLTTGSSKGGFDYSVGASYSITKNLSVSATYVGVDGESQDRYTNDTVVGSLKLAF